MESLVAKLNAEKAAKLRAAEERAAQEKIDQESLAGKLTEEKRNKDLEVLRGNIASLEARRASVAQAVANLAAAYERRSAAIATSQSDTQAITRADADFGRESSLLRTEILEKEDFAELLAERGVANIEQLVAHADFQGTPEVARFEVKKTATEITRRKKTERVSSLQAAVGKREKGTRKVSEDTAPVVEGSVLSVGDAKKALESVLPEGLTFSFEAETDPHKRGSEKREESIKANFAAVARYVAGLSAELEALKLRTPEGRKEIKDRLRRVFDTRFSKTAFFGEYFPPRVNTYPDQDFILVTPIDVAAAEKCGSDLVIEAIEDSVHDRLTSEVAARKEKEGIVTTKEGLKQFQGYPDRITNLEHRVTALREKRDAALEALRKAGESNASISLLIQSYFGRGSDEASFAKTNFADAWLVHSEKVFFSRGLPDFPFRSDQIKRDGIPGVIAGFLHEEGNARLVRDMLQVTGMPKLSDRRVSLVDCDLCERYLAAYERFLDAFLNVVQTKPDSIPNGSNENKGMIALVQDAGVKTEQGPYRGVQKVEPQVQQILDGRENFEKAERAVREKEGVVDIRARNRKELIDAYIEHYWAEQELRSFNSIHSNEVWKLAEKKKKVEESSKKGKELVSLVPKTFKALAMARKEKPEIVKDFLYYPDRNNILYLKLGVLEEQAKKFDKDVEDLDVKIQTNRSAKPAMIFGNTRSVLDKKWQTLLDQKKAVEEKITPIAATIVDSRACRQNILTVFPSEQDLAGIGFVSISSEYTDATIDPFLHEVVARAATVAETSLAAAEQAVLTKHAELEEACKRTLEVVRQQNLKKTN